MKLLFLLATLLAIRVLADKPKLSEEKVDADLLALGLKQKILDQINEYWHNYHKEMAAAELVEKVLQKKGIVEAMSERQHDLNTEFFSKLPEDQEEIYSKYVNEHLAAF
ncbi:hypothetical protein CRE_07087 [Caenorhabditis remanei]|uniref:Uncharacterized protein n=1 Tax=Caenorhabditis remanei TaxID=31234 RepID=E3NKP9_CAERE|nr:hypothetical protein CRE_07087 [Caenorhabditis remanei]